MQHLKSDGTLHFVSVCGPVHRRAYAQEPAVAPGRLFCRARRHPRQRAIDFDTGPGQPDVLWQSPHARGHWSAGPPVLWPGGPPAAAQLRRCSATKVLARDELLLAAFAIPNGPVFSLRWEIARIYGYIRANHRNSVRIIIGYGSHNGLAETIYLWCMRVCPGYYVPLLRFNEDSRRKLSLPHVSRAQRDETGLIRSHKEVPKLPEDEYSGRGAQASSNGRRASATKQTESSIAQGSYDVGSTTEMKRARIFIQSHIMPSHFQ